MAPNIIVNPTIVYQGYNLVKRAISNWVPTADGRYMCCWLDTTTRELITGYSIDLDFLSANYAIESVVTTPSIVVSRVAGSPTSLYRRGDGKVLLFIVNNDYDSWVKCYISASGNGDDWVFYGLVFESVAASYRSDNMSAHVTIPVALSSGRLVLAFTTGSQYWLSGYNFITCLCAISDNGGVNWTITGHMGSSGVYGGGQICLLPDGSMFFSWLYGGGSEQLIRSLDSGITWTQVASWNTTFANSGLHSWLISYYYDPITTTAYAYSSAYGFIAYLENPTGSNFSNITAWTVLRSGFISTTPTPGCRIYMLSGYLLFHSTVYGNSYLYSSIPSAPISKLGRHAIYYMKSLESNIRIRNIKTLDTVFARSRNLKHKVDVDTWGGATL